ncbi:MAG: nuclear transport factor 2 family protein [Microscillaceae bacterium]|nr:nuclear transport factor 2 family protein [Microscillaceae bacterium]
MAAEEKAVLKTVYALFEGMRAGDSLQVKAVFHPQARLMTTSVSSQNQETSVREESPWDFARAIGQPHDQVYDERLRTSEVRIDGPLATVWTEYTFYLGEQKSHCGVNAFQLIKTAAGWKILLITDTRRREPCPEGR